MQAPASSSQLDDSSRTLWAGSLPPYVDETFLYNLFARAFPPIPFPSSFAPPTAASTPSLTCPLQLYVCMQNYHNH